MESRSNLVLTCGKPFPKSNSMFIALLYPLTCPRFHCLFVAYVNSTNESCNCQWLLAYPNDDINFNKIIYTGIPLMSQFCFRPYIVIVLPLCLSIDISWHWLMLVVKETTVCTYQASKFSTYARTQHTFSTFTSYVKQLLKWQAQDRNFMLNFIDGTF